MNKTKIDWTDWSWNPVTGCRHGCPYCYARALSHRFGRSFEPEFHPEWLGEASQARPGEKVFVCSMADLFGEWVPREWIEAVIYQVALRPSVVFQFLTKNPYRYLDFDWPKNAWLGATAVNQNAWDHATLHARPHFLSCEPLLGPIEPNGADLKWLIIGAQTGPRAVQPEEAWVERLEDWADGNGVPVFHKDNLECRRSAPRKEFPGK